MAEYRKKKRKNLRTLHTPEGQQLLLSYKGKNQSDRNFNPNMDKYRKVLEAGWKRNSKSGKKIVIDFSSPNIAKVCNKNFEF